MPVNSRLSLAQPRAMTGPGLVSRLILISPFFFWGTAMVAMKQVLPQTSPFFVAAVRLVPAGILVLLTAWLLRRQSPQGLRAWAWIGLFALVDGTLFQGFLAAGLSRTGAGLGSVMIDSQPLVVALLAAWLYREKIGLWGWLGLLIGITGISLIGIPQAWWFDLLQGEVAHVSFSWAGLGARGEFWMLLAALAMAVGTVMMGKVKEYADPIMATGWHMILGGLPLLGLGLGGDTWPWINLTGLDWLNLGYATLLGSALSYGLFFYFASQGNLTSLSSLTFLTPVFALSFGQLILQETLTSFQLWGVGLTLVSIYLVNQRQQLSQLFRQRPMGQSLISPAKIPIPELVSQSIPKDS